MFTNFFLELRQAKVPVSIKEYLALMEAMEKQVAEYSVDDFYYLSRSVLVKDERNLDKFDRVVGDVLVHRFHQRQVLLDGDRHLGLAQFEDEVHEHRVFPLTGAAPSAP